MLRAPPTRPVTAVMLTRNRPRSVAAQLRLFRLLHFGYPLIVADSSDATDASVVRDALADSGAQYASFQPEIHFYEKLERALSMVDTPFVVLLPDRKITLVHAIEAGLERLVESADLVAALGYVLGYSRHDRDIDINRVAFFTPSIAEDSPLHRHYHLMRRYQVSLWAVFRTRELAISAAQARRVAGSLFQEITFMNAIVLQGKIARLPIVFGLQGDEQSSTPLHASDPLYWFLNDARSFFKHYLAYRDALTDFIVERAIPVPPGMDLTQLIDTIHGVWLSSNFHGGVLNHAAQLLLGDPIRPLDNPREPPSWREIAEKDVVHPAAGRHRYIWRNSVLNAEPRHEIIISRDEMKRVEQQLDAYFGWWGTRERERERHGAGSAASDA
jgi:glycosyltransferase domain-containing protein